MRRDAGVRPRRVARLGLLLSLMGSVSAAAAPARLKVFVSVDMEGIAGVVIERQTGSEGHDYPIHREQMLAEANAAVAGAFDAGATEVVVLDSHGNGMNLRPDLLDSRARLISGTPRPWGMVAGLDGTFDAMVFIGYHASGSIPDGVLAHTFNLSALSVRLNGQVVGEGGLNAAVGGHFNVPVVFGAGDRAFVRQFQTLSTGTELLETKEGLSSSSAALVPPAVVIEGIRRGVKAGLERRAMISPWQVAKPITLEVELGNSSEADRVMLIPAMSRVDGRTVRYVAPDAPTMYRIFVLIDRLTGR
jgi:D-amino peptidase